MSELTRMHVLHALAMLGRAKTSEVVEAINDGNPRPKTPSSIRADLHGLRALGLVELVTRQGDRMHPDRGAYAQAHRWQVTDDGRTFAGGA